MDIWNTIYSFYSQIATEVINISYKTWFNVHLLSNAQVSVGEKKHPMLWQYSLWLYNKIEFSVDLSGEGRHKMYSLVRHNDLAMHSQQVICICGHIQRVMVGFLSSDAFPVQQDGQISSSSDTLRSRAHLFLLFSFLSLRVFISH